MDKESSDYSYFVVSWNFGVGEFQGVSLAVPSRFRLVRKGLRVADFNQERHGRRQELQAGARSLGSLANLQLLDDSPCVSSFLVWSKADYHYQPQDQLEAQESKPAFADPDAPTYYDSEHCGHCP